MTEVLDFICNALEIAGLTLFGLYFAYLFGLLIYVTYAIHFNRDRPGASDDQSATEPTALDGAAVCSTKRQETHEGAKNDKHGNERLS